jgi:hypothetical protein
MDHRKMNLRTYLTVIVGLPGALSGPGLLAAPLHDAVRAGDLAEVSTLVVSAPDINEADSYGVTALQLAVRKNNLKIVEFLVTNGADLDIMDPRLKYTALHKAAYKGNFAIMELLVGSGGNVDLRNDQGASPLHLAARKGHDKIAELLIANGAGVNARDAKEYTPLHNAAWNGHNQAVNKSDERVAIDGYDPVAYFTMTAATKGSESINHVWLDETWLFVNEDHKALFAANPTRYMPNYGGYCSYDPYLRGHGHTVDPTAWRIVDDKLYLFESESTAAHAIPTAEWDKVKAGLIQ